MVNLKIEGLLSLSPSAPEGAWANMVSLLRPSWSLTESERCTVLCVRRSEVGTDP